jgi:hypothetical protein
MGATLYAHLPGVRLVEGDVTFAGGALRALPFDEWVRFDDSFPYAAKAFARSAAVFWVGRPQLDEEVETGRWVESAIWPLHAAFLLDARAPLLPTPLISTNYVLWDARPEVGMIAPSPHTMLGPAERELLVYGSPITYPFTAAELAVVERRCEFLTANRIRALDDDIGAGLQVLEETARPDSWYGGDQLVSQLHGFVRCMAACEDLLLPGIDEDEKTDITRTFGRHAAALLLPADGDREQGAGHFSDLYRLRTALIHGRMGPEEGDPDQSRSAAGRLLLRNVLMAALLLKVRAAQPVPLWQVLRENLADGGHQELLARTLAEMTTL